MKTMTLRTVVAVGLLALNPASVAGQGLDLQLPADEKLYPTGDLFIQNLDAVWTAAGEILENASILIRDGIIREMGPDLTVPEGVTVMDGRGLTAIPGLVDEHTHTGTLATNEGSVPIVPEVRSLDVLNPDDFNIYRALSGGVTTARTMHGSANPIGGTSATLKMRWGMEVGEQLLVSGAPMFVKFALGENVTRKGSPAGGGRAARFPASRQGVEALMWRRSPLLWSTGPNGTHTGRTPERFGFRREGISGWKPWWTSWKGGYRFTPTPTGPMRSS
jgi:hypothetical protein